MRLIESLKKKKIILINIFLTLYVGTNLIGGERGLISYFEKKKIQNQLVKKEQKLNQEVVNLKKQIDLITNNNIDFLDILLREKLKYGTKDEIIIKIK